MLKEIYWFPDMNKMTERVVDNGYECQITTKQHRQEPVKMAEIPENHGRLCQLIFGAFILMTTIPLLSMTRELDIQRLR